MEHLSVRLAAAALSLVLLTAVTTGCTGNPARRGAPGGATPGAPGGATPGAPGDVTRGAPGGVARGGLVGNNTVGRAGGGGAAVDPARMDLGLQVSTFVANLSILNGGTAGTTGPARAGGGGGGSPLPGPGGAPSGIGMTHTAGAVGSPSGAGNATGAATPGAGTTGQGSRVGVSTLIVGNAAFIGIDPSSLALAGGGTPGGGATTGDLSTYIRSRVIAQFPQLAEVFVTTDRAQVSRIARVHGDMLTGMPSTRMMPEILTLIRAMGSR